MRTYMLLMTEHSDTARVSVWANKEDCGSRCFTVDAHLYQGDIVKALGVARYYDLRKAMAEADAVLAGDITETEQFKGEVLS